MSVALSVDIRAAGDLMFLLSRPNELLNMAVTRAGPTPCPDTSAMINPSVLSSSRTTSKKSPPIELRGMNLCANSRGASLG